ncbi:hypothetical protein IJU97_02425 [bacterium]|nr:hypothetical protein [bacterium]
MAKFCDEKAIEELKKIANITSDDVTILFQADEREKCCTLL